MIFTLPWALLSLAGLPALAAIYFLRSRSRRQPVSSLMLWADLTRAREGGRLLQRMHVPLLLLLELLVVALLAVALTGPQLRIPGAPRTLVMVLDDSFSMRAGGDDSPRNRAARAIEDRLRDSRNTTVQFFLAGAEPRILADRVQSVARARELLEGWRCLSPTADLDAAVGLASAVGGRGARILVLTDRKPPDGAIREGKVVWQAFGRERPNAAIVNAARSTHEDRDRCLVEVANFSTRPQQTTLTLSAGPNGRTLVRRAVEVAPGRKTTMFFDLPAGTPVLRATLDDDALMLDNQVTLLPDAPRPVRVALAVENRSLGQAIRRALDASHRARLTARAPDLLMTDRTFQADLPHETWSVQFVVEEEAEAFIGPFVQDRSHPLCEGLDLSGVIWAAGKTPPLPGPAVISVGNVALVTDSERAGGRRDVRIRIQPNLSGLIESTNWPVLIWNLLAYRAEHLPGIQAPNVRLGSDVRVSVAQDARELRIRSPDGLEQVRAVRDRSVIIGADQPGIYEVQVKGQKYPFAVNALHPAESDLADCAAGEWGRWIELAHAQQGTYRPVAWLALVLALGVMVAHLAFAGQAQNEEVGP